MQQSDLVRRRRLRIARRKVGAALLPMLAPSTLRLVSRTWRVQILGREHRRAVEKSAGRIFTLWHGRMLLPLPEHADLGYTVLVSPSDDGSLVNSLLGRFGYTSIRGSSNERPARAVRVMLERLGSGATVVITPDGPRGPRHSMNPGPAWMSRETGFPILPLGCVCDRAWHLSSWDRFTIPKPRARVVIAYGAPIRVASDAGDEELAQAAVELRSRLIEAERAGFRRLDKEPDW